MPSCAGLSANGRPAFYFFRYTFRPIFSSRFGTVMLPSVEAMIMVFPEAEGPNSLERSILMVNNAPSTVMSTFFILFASLSEQM